MNRDKCFNTIITILIMLGAIIIIGTLLQVERGVQNGCLTFAYISGVMLVAIGLVSSLIKVMKGPFY